MPTEGLLPPASLARYADAIVKASLAVDKGDTLVVVGEPEHRELLAAVAVSAYKAGATHVDVVTNDPLVTRARLVHGSDDALGALSPWTRLLLREASGPQGAMAYITGAGETGYLDGVPPERIATDYQRFAKHIGFVRRAQLNLDSRWSIAGWPADHWASQVYPNLEIGRAKRKLAKDLLNFCRLTDADGAGTSGWTKHLKTLKRRGHEAHEARPDRPRAARPRHRARRRPVCRHALARRAGDDARRPRHRSEHADDEVFTSPEASATSGTFRCTLPLSFRGRLIEGLRGEFAGGRLVRLEADSKPIATSSPPYLDSDKGGHRLGEVALVDASSRIGKARRIYYNTLLDENAATHIAFGSGFGGTRTDKPARGVNQSTTHLDVMIGSPKLEVTGIGPRGKRIPLIRDGLWQI